MTIGYLILASMVNQGFFTSLYQTSVLACQSCLHTCLHLHYLAHLPLLVSCLQLIPSPVDRPLDAV